jgi:hypothetical protein
MPKSQLSWVRSQHPPTQWKWGAADEAVLNNEHKKKKKRKKIFFVFFSHRFFIVQQQLCSSMDGTTPHEYQLVITASYFKNLSLSAVTPVFNFLSLAPNSLNR